jgi:hypothetical protein
MLRSLVAVLTAFVVFVVVHFLHFHFFPPVERINALLLTTVLGAILYLVLLKLLPSDEVLAKKLRLGKSAMKALPVAIGLLLYALLFIGYLEFYFTADRSITFRMLRITNERPNQAITTEEMLAAYDVPSILVRRLGDLEYGGYYTKEGEYYKLTPKGKLAVGIYGFTIDFLHLSKY